MSRMKTPKFHLVDGPASADLRQGVDSCDFPLPPSYTEFALRFGNAELYRYGSNYYITIFAGPRGAESSEGDAFVHIGRTWTSHVYFKEALLVAGHESPVFEWFNNGIRQTAVSFEDWLKIRCESARRRFKKKDWNAIERGPTPFTTQEQAIVEARRQFLWRVVGIAPNEDLRFEIHNG